MTQLREQGWLHHLARHAVACFLTRGDLYQSWEVGAKVFDLCVGCTAQCNACSKIVAAVNLVARAISRRRYLLDSDWSINNCNWMWLSASAFYHTFFRVYSPVSFPKKYPPKCVSQFHPRVVSWPRPTSDMFSQLQPARCSQMLTVDTKGTISLGNTCDTFCRCSLRCLTSEPAATSPSAHDSRHPAANIPSFIHSLSMNHP
jgi:hypothetical protein